MKQKLILLVSLITIGVKAQTFNATSFSGDGYPVGMGFPSKIEKSIKPSANDTMLMAYSGGGGITYVLTVSKVKDKSFAERSIPGIVKRLESKASKVDLKNASTLLGNASTYMNYVNDKGSFISIHVFNIDRYIFQIYTLNKTAYLTDNQNSTFYNTLVFEKNISSSSQNTNLPTKNTTTQPVSNTTSQQAVTNNNNSSPQTITNSGAWNVNDRAEIFDNKEKKWFGCIILKVNSNGTYKIGYDGYADTYDEDVTADRLNKPTSNTTPSFPGYVKAVKGQKITIKGNLKNGQIMEDLEWAESSSMACWVGIRNVEFEGKHVAYWFDLPKKSIVKITVTPASTNSRINIYGYSGFDFIKTPPEVSRCTACEASFPEWIGQPNLNEPSKPQTIEFNATTIRNRVYFAVAGAKGVVEGDYTITIDLQ
ncbi:MAG: hypothetical protein SFY56_08950 [Bacteroidota bacterium]|nr:hypothetical protein [Bacteroidota bacterium]